MIKITTQYAFDQRKLHILFFLFFIVGFGKSALTNEIRVWKTTTNNEFRGELVRIREDGNTIVVRDANGVESNRTISRLSNPDKEYVKKWQASRPAVLVKNADVNEAKPADVAEGLIEVIATGLGVDQDAAEKNAMRNAVSQAVGSMVEADRLIKDGEIIRNQILTLSAGFVKSYDVIGKPVPVDGGLVEIQIKAWVKRSDLELDMRKKGIINSTVNWEDLFAERFTKSKTREDGINMLKWMIEEHLMNCVSVKAGQPRWDHNDKKIVLPVHLEIDYKTYSAFVERFSKVLKVQDMSITSNTRKDIGTERIITRRWNNRKQESILTTQMSYDYRQGNHFGYSGSGEYCILYVAPEKWPTLAVQGQKKGELSLVGYSLTREVFEDIRNSIIALRTKDLVVELFDQGDNIVAVEKIKSFFPFCDYEDHNTIMRAKNAPILFFPMLDQKTEWINSRNTFWPGTPEHVEEIYFDIPENAMRNIREIKFRYEAPKPAGLAGAEFTNRPDVATSSVRSPELTANPVQSDEQITTRGSERGQYPAESAEWGERENTRGRTAYSRGSANVTNVGYTSSEASSSLQESGEGDAEKGNTSKMPFFVFSFVFFVSAYILRGYMKAKS